MQLKDPDKMKKEWWEIDIRLRLMLAEIDVLAYPRILTITELLRSDSEQAHLHSIGAAPDKTSVHQFGRGADFRPFEDQEFNEWLHKEINSKYIYDPHRPHMFSLIRHTGTKDHFHLQCIPMEDLHKLFKGGNYVASV